VWHGVWVLMLVPLWKIAVVTPAAQEQRVEIAWYGPIKDLPAIAPAARPIRKPEALATPKADPEPDAQAFHPRQTILNAPMRPNHPRQTLIQPAAAPEPPKILPPLPNIVSWSASAPAALHIDGATVARLRPKTPAARPVQDLNAPELQAPDRELEAIELAATEAAIQRPSLPVAPLSGRRRSNDKITADAAPDLGVVSATNANSTALIALSAAPAPTAPPEVPAGNLQSTLAISPARSATGSRSASAAGTNATQTGVGNGPVGLSISGGSAKTSNTAGLGGSPGTGTGRPTPGTVATPGTPGRPAIAASAAPVVRPAPSQTNPLVERIKPGATPESLLGAKQIYTLHVNMPNLTSATGSWILNFAELADSLPRQPAYANTADLQGPEPLRKVDPKYPPELRSSRVQGEVVLFAVIREDGSVDSIQLVSGVDAALDANAMQALAQWKFRPAVRQGAPVELEAIVHIPFRASTPLN
jgi:TonB family protein